MQRYSNGISIISVSILQIAFLVLFSSMARVAQVSLIGMHNVNIYGLQPQRVFT